METNEAEPGLVLRQRFEMHARIQGGSLYVYGIFDGADRIGSYSVSTVRPRRKAGQTYAPKAEVTRKYVLAHDVETIYSTVAEFKRAYQQHQRDVEWDAAKPKEQEKSDNV